MDDFFPVFHWANLLIVPSLMLGYTVHELGHALSAYFLGDYSQVESNQISLNPFKHMPWFGSLSFILFGIGWPKPLRANMHNFKRGYLDLCLVALSGPAASFTLSLVGFLLTAFLAAAVVYLGGISTDEVLKFLIPLTGETPDVLDLQAWTMAFTTSIFKTSMWLTVVSLLPLPGLDGFVAITSLIIFLRQGAKRQKQHHEVPGFMPEVPAALSLQRKRRNSAAEIHFKMGAEYHGKNQYEDAIARYRQAISNDQNFGPAYVNLGLAYLALSRRKEAIQAFRGAVQYADDKKSQASAWRQLHQLSELNPTDEAASRQSMAQMGAAPWTDTRPRPNWLGLSVASLLLLLAGIILYVYLLSGVIEVLRP